MGGRDQRRRRGALRVDQRWRRGAAAGGRRRGTGLTDVLGAARGLAPRLASWGRTAAERFRRSRRATRGAGGLVYAWDVLRVVPFAEAGPGASRASAGTLSQRGCSAASSWAAGLDYLIDRQLGRRQVCLRFQHLAAWAWRDGAARLARDAPATCWRDCLVLGRPRGSDQRLAFGAGRGRRALALACCGRAGPPASGCPSKP